MERQTRLAFDVGQVRIGVASCDPQGLLATPVQTLKRDKYGLYLEDIQDLLEEYEPVELVVGMPLLISGKAGQATQMAAEFVNHIRKIAPQLPIRLIDERISSVNAHRQLNESGLDSRHHRQVVDQVAAVAILELVLEATKRNKDIGTLA